MIPKITTGADFEGLRDYLVKNRDVEQLDLRGVRSLDHAPDEMAAVAGLSARVSKPVFHISFSAAEEDGTLDRGAWLALVDAAEAELGLSGHQRIVVRHMDHDYDHIHVFWCTIAASTGQIPPKIWMRKPDAAAPDLGPLALRGPDLDRVPIHERERRSFNAYALLRLQWLCRCFEEERELRQLRTPRELARAREAGELRAPAPGDRKREERTGATPVAARGEVVRAALDAPDWDAARRRLNEAGLDLKASMAKTGTGEERIRGLVIFDLADEANRAKASSFDLPGRRYGLAHVDGRHGRDMIRFERWWPERGRAVPPEKRQEPAATPLLAEFQRLHNAHRRDEEQRRLERKRLLVRHASEKRKLRARLMQDRRDAAAQLAPSERRAFYRKFSEGTRVERWSELVDRHKAELLPLRRRAFPNWARWKEAATRAAGLVARSSIAAPIATPAHTHLPEQKGEMISGSRSVAGEKRENEGYRGVDPVQLGDGEQAPWHPIDGIIVGWDRESGRG